ncbi:WD40-repeat-containing domain protein [Emericellopsis atlantica]|uniref:WD40-repeat-containing domain protein n=1 Tax=Emericellopsis atlantica TaxID=2614577 RepID=A0A9P7ZTV7_9HYPO|nr:WD40-repeat-containing domain protein [Emericellopsis atlantica]KAG9258274.1 WD40-repeat-containing domain protein [Emericellopsis atlantica]
MYTLTNTEAYSLPSSDWITSLLRTSATTLTSISTDGSLSLHNPAALPQGPLKSFKTTHDTISVLQPWDDNVVATSGWNGTVTLWDFRQQKGKALDFKACDAPVLSMATHPGSQALSVGTELTHHQASIHIFDIRAAQATPKAAYHDLHSDDITTLTYHPTRPNILLSGSTDGLVSVHDTSITDEDEMTIQTLNLNASIHTATFVGDSSIVSALSHDEKFALYDISDTRENGDALVDFGDLRQGLGCQYVCDVIPKRDGSGAIVGCGAQDNHEFGLVFLAKGQQEGLWTLDKSAGVGLPGGHGEEIVRDFCFFDEEQVVFTGGEDGKIKAWRPS